MLNHSETAGRAMNEILADVAAGIVPQSCASFSELHTSTPTP
jgi:hypothetical protein